MKKWIVIVSGRDIDTDDMGNSVVSQERILHTRFFEEQEYAYKYSVDNAEKEVNRLSDECDKDRSFNIPEDDKYEKMEQVKVYCYIGDDTYLVTRWTIREIDFD